MDDNTQKAIGDVCLTLILLSVIGGFTLIVRGCEANGGYVVTQDSK